MTRVVVSSMVVVTAAVALGGCYEFARERSEEERAATERQPRMPTGSLVYNDRGEAEVLQGGMGSVTGFAQQFPEMHIVGSRTSTTVRIDAEDTSARWWVMTSLTVLGGLDHAALQPGARLVFSRTGSSVEGLRVSVLGCSGPRRPHYTYDRYADTVTVHVLPGSFPSTRRMVFTAVFPSSTPGGPSQRVQGAFEYELR